VSDSLLLERSPRPPKSASFRRIRLPCTAQLAEGDRLCDGGRLGSRKTARRQGEGVLRGGDPRPSHSTSLRSAGSTSGSLATTSGRPNRSNRGFRPCEICAPRSSMPLNVRFGTDSAMTPEMALAGFCSHHDRLPFTLVA
jgi:hypothetical protein